MSDSGEIFSNSTLNFKGTVIREVVSAFYGRCYTVVSVAPLPDEDSLVLGLNPSMNYKMFIHNEGEEIWIAGSGYFPLGVIIFTLGKKLDPDPDLADSSYILSLKKRTNYATP